jgi:hypothetical protein
VQHDGAGVGQLDAGGPLGERVARRGHQVGDENLENFSVFRVN